MANVFQSSSMTVAATGIQLASGVASSGALLPNMSSGEKPRFIRVAATAPACIRLGKTTATAATTDLQVQPGDAVVLTTNGMDFIACIQVTAGGIVQVSPLENM